MTELSVQPARANGAAAPAHDAVARACALIDAADERAPTLAALAAAVGLSPAHFQRVFTRAVGVSPRDYARQRRLGRVKALLRRGEPVTGALYEAGYGSSSRLYESADRALGMTPATYRKGGEGAEIRHAFGQSALGTVLVAATARGICFVAMDDSRARLLGALKAEFPAAAIGPDDGRLAGWLAEIIRRVDGAPPRRDLPLDVRATAFQWRVWRALSAIPRGETRSYAELAQSLGVPKAPRAVGRACATNPVSILVPCHRAVAGDGQLRGYRWGLARKKALLAAEAKAKPR